jgi:hypothetical protein
VATLTEIEMVTVKKEP